VVARFVEEVTARRGDRLDQAAIDVALVLLRAVDHERANRQVVRPATVAKTFAYTGAVLGRAVLTELELSVQPVHIDDDAGDAAQR
jgi:hypothetical protein